MKKHKYTIKMDAYIMYHQGVIIKKIKFKTQLLTRCEKIQK